jgi:hypothetical protein
MNNISLFFLFSIIFLNPIFGQINEEKIKKLEEMKKAFIEKDEKKISNFIVFPLFGKTIYDKLKDCKYIDKSQIGLSQNDSIIIEREIFLMNYECIFNNSFKKILLNIDFKNLRKKSFIEIISKSTADYCYNYYSIEIKNDSIILKLHVNEKRNKEKIDEEFCDYEWEIFYIFKFVNNELIFCDFIELG